MSKKLLSLHGLKFNPFSAQVPTEALWTSPPVESFCWRIEQQIGEGGFALATGDPGTGKSAALRLLALRLTRVRDLCVGVLSRPQASLADFYRELGHLFNVPLSPHNRWASAKVLREKWLQHQEAALVRPVLLVDEAQEMAAAVFSELRLLSSARFDSQPLLCVILAGDARLIDNLRREALIPLGSRIRTRLVTEPASRDALSTAWNTCSSPAGNTRLLTAELAPHLVRPRRRQLPHPHRHGHRTARHRRPAGSPATRRKTLPAGLRPTRAQPGTPRWRRAVKRQTNRISARRFAAIATPPLSDEAVIHIHNVLEHYLHLFENHYANQIRRYYDERRPQYLPAHRPPEPRPRRHIDPERRAVLPRSHESEPTIAPPASLPILIRGTSKRVNRLTRLALFLKADRIDWFQSARASGEGATLVAVL